MVMSSLRLLHSTTSSTMVIMKNSHIVKPAESTPHEIMPVSDCDHVKPVTHAPTIYIYKPTTDSVKDAIHILKDSLSKALVIFYPLAGRLHWIGGGRVELHCNSMGAFLAEAESNLRIDDLGDFLPNSPEIVPLLPPVDLATTPIEEVPLLLVQLTKFSCGSLTLGVKLSHMLADGRSALDFLSEWAKLACGEKSKELPFLDRRVLQPKVLHAALPRLKYSQLLPPPLLIGHSDDMEEKQKPTKVTILKLAKEHVDKLKAKANQTVEVDKFKNFRAFTRFETVAAHVWRCASEARKNRSDQETVCFVTVDFRNRLKPPLPPRYFGNAVVFIPAVATAGDLLSKPLGYASAKIREAIDSVTDEYVNSFLVSSRILPDVSAYRHAHTVGCSQAAFFGNPNLVITSWIGLNLYGLDFGWGKEIYIGPAGLGFDGRAFVVPSRDGDGSLSLPFRLQVEHLDDFVKSFYEEI